MPTQERVRGLAGVGMSVADSWRSPFCRRRSCRCGAIGRLRRRKHDQAAVVAARPVLPRAGKIALEPRREVQAARPRRGRDQDPRAAGAASRACRAEPEVPVVEKQADAARRPGGRRFLGGGLAEGLTRPLRDNPRIRIVDRTNGSSGFVRDDFFNWPAKIAELIDAEKPAAVVVMLGANDRQQMRVGDVRETARSENWTKEYPRAGRRASPRRSPTSKVPFLWVGVPAFKSSKMLSDMLAFNEIYRTAADGAAAEFIDVWDGFVDENGAFVIDRPRHQRPAGPAARRDGINLTRPASASWPSMPKSR